MVHRRAVASVLGSCRFHPQRCPRHVRSLLEVCLRCMRPAQLNKGEGQVLAAIRSDVTVLSQSSLSPIDISRVVRTSQIAPPESPQQSCEHSASILPLSLLVPVRFLQGNGPGVGPCRAMRPQTTPAAQAHSEAAGAAGFRFGRPPFPDVPAFFACVLRSLASSRRWRFRPFILDSAMVSTFCAGM